MPGPGGRADEFQGGLLQRPGHEEGVDDLDGAQPFQHGPAGGQRAHPEAGRGRLGQRADVHDDPVRVVGGQRRRQRACVGVHQPPYEVVLDDERAGRAGDPQHLGAPSGGQHGAGGVLEQGLAHEHTGAARAERVRQQVRSHAVGVHRDGHGPQPRGAGDGQHARVGGRLHQYRGAGRGQRAQRGGQRGLAARGDQDLGGGDAAAGPADAAREPLAQFRQPVQRGQAPGAGPAAGPGERRGHGPLGPERGVQIAVVELDHAGRRRGERDRDTGGVHRARQRVGGAVRAERHLLPGGVPGCGGRCGRGRPERAGSGPGHHQALGRQLRQRPGDGHRAHPVLLDQGATRRQLSTG